MPNVLITARYFAVDPEPLALLSAHGCELIHTDLDWTLGDGNVSEGRAVELLRGVDAAIISSLPLTEQVMAHANKLRVVAVRGVGYDSVDIGAATARRLPVLVAPGFTESVADYTFALMLAVARRVALADRLVRDGRWEVLVSTNICGKTIGIVGLGRIGKAVARRARGFDMAVLATDVMPDDAFARQYGVAYLPLPDLLRRADIVSINAPLSRETRYLIDEQALRLMQPHAFLINTARGARNVAILHTYDRSTANSEEFVRVLRSAKAVFFPGGRSRVLDDTYHDTLLEREVRGVLARGGVLAGDSAGAITLGCFWVSWNRGVDTLGVVSKGLCALRRVTVTPHVRTVDGDEMTAELQKYFTAHGDVIGINISEGSALVLQKSVAQVIGPGGVTIFDATKDPAKAYVKLTAGAPRDLSQ